MNHGGHRAADTFDPKTERIEDYKERFDFYCVAHGVEEAKQKALFFMNADRTDRVLQAQDTGESHPVGRTGPEHNSRKVG